MPKGRQRAARGGHKRSKQGPRPRRKQPHRNAKSPKLHSWTSSNAAKIEEYMTSHGVVRKPIVGDGNCLFRAMADQLGYGESRHREIRIKVVETIRADKEYFANFIDEEEDGGVDEYCDDMINDGVWGDDIELEAFRRAYGRAVVIYDASTGTPYVKPYNGDEGRGPNAVHLWKSDCHYESVRNKDGPFDGPSRVVYKDVKLSPDDIERIKKEHEDAVVEELQGALPHIHVTEIRRLVKEYGDGSKVLELLAGIDAQGVNTPDPLPVETPENLPNGASQEASSSQDLLEDPLSASMEILHLNTGPAALEQLETINQEQLETPSQEQPETPNQDQPPTPPFSTETDDPKHKARQRRRVSAARKEKQAKREQKEAARRRKRMEALGIEKPDDTTSTAQEHILKAIVI